jgi:TRAP-type C4-dicarboxylate transport system substrate-binding protein
MPLYAPPDYGITMNWDTYNKLPADLQKVLDNSLPWAREETLKAYAQADADGKAYGEGLGLKFTTLSAEEKANWLKVIEPVQESQAAALDAKGYPDTELLQFVRTEIAKYVK